MSIPRAKRYRRIRAGLFIPQCNDEVDTHGAARRQVTRKERYRYQKQRYRCEGNGVRGLDAIEKALQQTSDRHSRDKTDGHADSARMTPTTV